MDDLSSLCLTHFKITPPPPLTPLQCGNVDADVVTRFGRRGPFVHQVFCVDRRVCTQKQMEAQRVAHNARAGRRQSPGASGAFPSKNSMLPQQAVVPPRRICFWDTALCFSCCSLGCAAGAVAVPKASRPRCFVCVEAPGSCLGSQTDVARGKRGPLSEGGHDAAASCTAAGRLTLTFSIFHSRFPPQHPPYCSACSANVFASIAGGGAGGGEPSFFLSSRFPPVMRGDVNLQAHVPTSRRAGGRGPRGTSESTKLAASSAHTHTPGHVLVTSGTYTAYDY